MVRKVELPKTYKVEAAAHYRDGHVDRIETETHGGSISDAMDNVEFERLGDAADREGVNVVRVTFDIREIA